MKKKKILLIPKSNSFEDVAQMYFLEKELVSFGHQVDSLSGPIFDFNMINILNEYNFDVIFRVNAGKPNEFTKSLSMKLAVDGKPGIMPSPLKPTMNRLRMSDKDNPKNDIFFVFLKYIIKASAGIATRFRR